MGRKKFPTLRPDERLPSTPSVEILQDSPEEEEDWAVVVVTRAYCPEGHELIDPQGQQFSGFGGITVRVRGDGREGLLTLSPIHGDSERGGDIDFGFGTRVEVGCPHCDSALRTAGACGCAAGGERLAIHTTPELDDTHVIVLCDRWGCHRSKVIDQGELLSTWVED